MVLLLQRVVLRSCLLISSFILLQHLLQLLGTACCLFARCLRLKIERIYYVFFSSIPPTHILPYYRPETKLREGNVFTRVCLYTGGVSVPGGRGYVPRGVWHYPQEQRPPSPPGNRHPRNHKSGRYAFYWNVFLFPHLFSDFFLANFFKVISTYNLKEICALTRYFQYSIHWKIL